MFAIFASCVAVLCSLLFRWLWKRKLPSSWAKIPSPPAIPILGTPRDASDEVIKRDLRWMKQGGSQGLVRVKGWTGKNVFCCFNTEKLKEVLVTKCTKFIRSSRLKILFPVLGNGVFSANGSLHSWQKKLLMPIFSHGSSRMYSKTFDENAKTLCKVWKELIASGRDEVNLDSYMSMLSIEILGDAILHYKLNGISLGENKVIAAFERALKGKFGLKSLILRSIIPFFDYLPFKANTDYKEATKLTNKLIDEIIAQKRRAMQAGKVEDGIPDLLTTCMKASDESSGKRMDDRLLRDNIWTFLLAGYETTSASLTWAFYNLAFHPEVQEKARSEVKCVVGDSDYILAEHVERLEYLTCVVKETLRFSSPVNDLFRECTDGVSLGDLPLSSDAEIMIPIAAIHRSDHYWKQADKFIPERFMDLGNPKMSGIAGKTYIPFSTGPRSCIGAKFAMQELKVVLARLLLTFRFSLDNKYIDIGTKCTITRRPHPSPLFKLTLV